MRVLLQSRADLFTKRGGDTVQVEQIRQVLEKLGVTVAVDLSPKPDLANYDLVHLFNLDWCRDTYLQALNAKQQDKPVVLSAIHHSFTAIDKMAAKSRYGISRAINPVLKTWHQRELFKSIYRAVFDPSKIKPTLVQLGTGVLVQQKELLKIAKVVIVQTEGEKRDIESDFGVIDLRFTKVVNGVNRDFSQATAGWCKSKYGLEDFVLSVGRIEPRKNQLAVIDAFQQAGLVGKTKLVLVGKLNWVLQPEYSWIFKGRVKECSWITHIDYVSYENMGSMFAAAKVAVLASWFETTGLVNLEAGLAGANVVSVRDRCEEYLGEGAFYCDPASVESIAQAIRQAYSAPRQTALRARVLDNYTWAKVGEQTLAVYKTLL